MGGDLASGAHSRDARRARIATHAMPFEPPLPPPTCAGLAPGAPGNDPSPFDVFGLLRTGLAALLLLAHARLAPCAVASSARGYSSPQGRVRHSCWCDGSGSLCPAWRRRRANDRPVVALLPRRSSRQRARGHRRERALVGEPAAFEPWGRLIDGGSLPTAFVSTENARQEISTTTERGGTIRTSVASCNPIP